MRRFDPVEALVARPRLVLTVAADWGAVSTERFALGAWRQHDGPSTVGAGLIVPDGHPAMAELAAWCERRTIDTPGGPVPWRCETLSGFFDPYVGRFRRVTYGPGWLVAADLGRVLGLCAEHWTSSRGRGAGGFTLAPPGWAGWRKDDDGTLRLKSISRHLPLLRVAVSTPTSYQVSYGRPPGGPGWGKRNPDGSAFRGRFFDVNAAAVPLDGLGSSDLADHAEASGLGRIGQPAAVSVDASGADELAAVLDVVDRLSVILDEEGRRWLTSRQDRRERVGRIDLRYTPTAGSLAARIVDRSGASPMLWRKGAPDDETMGRWIGAHHGGWLSCETAGAGLFPAADIDIHSGYPAMYELLGLSSLATAASFRTEDVTARLHKLLVRLAAGDVAPLFGPATWRTFGATICEVVPAGEDWAVECADDDFPDGHAAVRPLTTTEAVPFTWADVALAALRAGRVPNLRRAIRLVGVGTDPGAKARWPLFDDVTLRRGASPVAALVALRDRAKREGEDRRAAQFRVVVNALSYGNLQRIDQDLVRRGRRDVVVERASGGSFPPIGASVPSACRLAVGLAEYLIVAAGGTVASRDTDGLLLVSSPDGGPVTLGDGRTVGSISWGCLDAIMRRLDGLAPFGPGVPFFKPALREHEGHPLYGLALAVKRYALGTLTDDGGLAELVEATEHSLAGPVDPPLIGGRAADGRHAWTRAVAAEAMRQAIAAPRGGAPVVARWPWDEGQLGDGRGTPERFPQLQRCQVGGPADLSRLQRTYGLAPAPFGGYVLGTSRPPMGCRDAPPVAALDPGDDLGGWQSLAWHSQDTRAEGDPPRAVPVTTDPAKGGRAHVLRTLDDRALAWLRPRPLPVRPVIADDPRLVRPVGRGGRLVEARAAGDHETPTDELRASYAGPDLRPLIVEKVRAMGPAAFADAYGVGLDSAKSWCIGRKVPSAAWVRRLLPVIGGDRSGQCACGCGTGLGAGRRQYADAAHRERAKKRRQRAAGKGTR